MPINLNFSDVFIWLPFKVDCISPKINQRWIGRPDGEWACLLLLDPHVILDRIHTLHTARHFDRPVKEGFGNVAEALPSRYFAQQKMMTLPAASLIR
jgi:hypothetical protein